MSAFGNIYKRGIAINSSSIFRNISRPLGLFTNRLLSEFVQIGQNFGISFYF